ncbi:Glucan endo-1,3-beta-glucosidase BGN13.1 [Daldinia childiae]|uniref:Glucan endo-1,3-beta-glucosidase BGN13.1 n=1 Tax=Daldinia childiae TaxID=326645 RepID=UPI0014455FCC|nr:Glucan endo-1,3-beta-glucosidase BGN13.1 [Daldinia childiae]KAF3059335.1 Glucan endo-1,3-beta-glucosidase BGN13.1 [Daldinia childiae]
MAARPALQDASSRANQTPILPPSGKKAAGQPPATEVAVPAPKVAATAGKKRKSETSLDDDIAAYKQDLSHIETDHLFMDMSCNQVRGKINKLLDSDIMKKGEFCHAIGSNFKSINLFLSKRGSMDGAGSMVYNVAWQWFKQREMAGLKMPDVKKRQKTEAAAAAAAGSSGASKATVPLVSGTDINNVSLPGEETDSVPVYDTCDEVRRKINAHLKTPGLTAAQFCRDIYAQLRQPKGKCFQSKQLADFRGKKGATSGCTSPVFYTAYVYFEKKRIAEGKPKNPHRLKMESLWATRGGVDRQHDGRCTYITTSNKPLYMDQYGLSFMLQYPTGPGDTETISKRATSFWYANMDHTGQGRGYAPDLGDDSYPVYIAVKPGDGPGIANAIKDAGNGNSRNSQWLASQPRVVYIPPGTYEVSETIRMNTDTILMGDATDPPIIKAAAGFSGEQTLLSGNEFTALGWGVAQVAQLQNIKIVMASPVNGNGHTGIQLGRGSTLGLADVRVEHGQNGIWHNGHQQALYKSIYFYENSVGMLINGGNTISIIGATFDTVGTAVRHDGGSPWIALIDAKSISSGVTFATSGSRIVGEAWATITGNGDKFKDSANPKPVVSVGKNGDVGTAQIQDMRFTVSDVLPGAIILQFNIAGSSPGDVALWNSLITVGGTLGASALADACGDASNECQAAFIGLHLTSSSSAYIENVWNWVADHFTEGSGGCSIAAKGGVLVESTKGTWLHALGSEHWWLYQLNLRNAKNVMVSLLQSETNYDQGDNVQQIPPSPWKPDAKNWGDPDFSCGSDIFTYASASWAFFSGPGYQGCSGDCQDHMHWISETPINLKAYGICSKSTQTALHLGDGTDILTQPDFTGSWGSLVARYTP